jgi:hypothetical protein
MVKWRRSFRSAIVIGLARFLVPVLVAALPVPIHADITAEYYAWGPIGPTITVQVADNGDARVEMGGHLAAIRRDGVMYLVREDAQGVFVLRQDEFDRVEAGRWTGLEAALPELGDFPSAQVVKRGTEEVGGYQGIVLEFGESPAKGQPVTNGLMS